jgi:hypothetical protein
VELHLEKSANTEASAIKVLQREEGCRRPAMEALHREEDGEEALKEKMGTYQGRTVLRYGSGDGRVEIGCSRDYRGSFLLQSDLFMSCEICLGRGVSFAIGAVSSWSYTVSRSISSDCDFHCSCSRVGIGLGSIRAGGGRRSRRPDILASVLDSVSGTGGSVGLSSWERGAGPDDPSQLGWGGAIA